MKLSKIWKQIRTKNLFKSKFFSLREDQCEMPDGRVVPKYFVLDSPDWVQVVAQDENKNLILVHQYRYPGAGYFLEFPGGSTHADGTEDPKLAAEREMLEETGYASNEWQYLGVHYPNPALLSNRCHVFWAKKCRKVAERSLDPFEELEVQLMSLPEYIKYLEQSEYKHSLMLAALQMAMTKLI